MFIINILFCIFALIAILNFLRNVSQASGIDRGTRVPDTALISCASPNTRTSSENFQFNFGIYAFWVFGIVVGALFYILADNSWGGIVAAIAGIANVFSIRGILGATRRFMDRYAAENLSRFN